jgi:hypothetical protein
MWIAFAPMFNPQRLGSCEVNKTYCLLGEKHCMIGPLSKLLVANVQEDALNVLGALLISIGCGTVD